MAGEAFSEYKFSELKIDKDILRGLDKLGFELMTPIQAEAIPVILKGKDVIGQAQTGTGKTAAFGIPTLEQIDPKNKKLQAIILCPTRELAVQVAGELRSFMTFMHDVKILPVYGGQDIKRQIQALKGVQIVVGTPGRVMDHMNRKTIKLKDVKMCILDEADEMLKMGFREDMETILGKIEHPHQTCLFSATMPQEILDITHKFQCNPQLIKVTPKELTMERIKQYYYPVKWEYKTHALLRLMEYYKYNKSIVFCNTKSMTLTLCEELKKAGYDAVALNGDLDQRQRDRVMDAFRKGAANVMIATDIAARGIDVDDVEAVFNYDIPQETEFYVHRIGRTGRAGREGVSHTLCKSKEFLRIREIENICRSKMEEKNVPSSALVNEAKERKTLDEALATIETGLSDKYVATVEKYCAEHNIEVSALAAAFLKQELGEFMEDIDLNLPKKPTRKKKSHNDRSENDRFRGKKSRDDRGQGKKSHDSKSHDSKSRDKKYHDNVSGDNRSKDRSFKKLGKEERKEIKRKNREISKRELKRAIKKIK